MKRMLNIDPVVKVEVNVGTNTASSGVFDVGMILTPTAGTGTPLTKTSRFAVYDSLSEIETGSTDIKPAFASTTDVYKAAKKYFSVENAPKQVVVVYYETDPDAEAYDSTAAYEIGDYCTYDGKRWQCNTAIAEGGEAWNASHWTEITRTDDTPTNALLDAIGKGAQFYAVFYSPKDSESTADVKANLVSLVSALNSLKRGVLFYGVTGSVASVVLDGSIMSDMSASGTKRAVGLYCTSEPNDAAGLMGTAMGLAAKSDTNAFALCYKGIASATANNITQSEINAIKALNGNVFVQRTRGRACVENGATASGLRFDEVLYIDRIVYDIQNGIYDLISNSPTKFPQDDSTNAVFLNELFTILDAYYAIGVLSDSIWRGAPVMGVQTGDTIDHGHAELVDSYDLQSEADRDAHKAMPITVLLCLSGSVETIVITVDVQT